MMENDLFNNAEQKLEIEEKKEELKREREAMLREAVSKYQDAAMEGDPRAQYALAHAYFQAQDYVTSVLVESGGQEGIDLCVDAGGFAVCLRPGCGQRPC